jgi:3-phosphoglycerate kinase
MQQKNRMKSASLKPAAERLEALLKADSPDTTILPVLFADDCLNADAVVAQLQPGQALLLENVRFYKNEGSKKESERLSMATKIASYGDVYVSDAFGTAHRNSATSTFYYFLCLFFFVLIHQKFVSFTHTRSLPVNPFFHFFRSDGHPHRHEARLGGLLDGQGNQGLFANLGRPAASAVRYCRRGQGE